MPRKRTRPAPRSYRLVVELYGSDEEALVDRVRCQARDGGTTIRGWVLRALREQLAREAEGPRSPLMC